jgi:hypothetical protein
MGVRKILVCSPVERSGPARSGPGAESPAEPIVLRFRRVFQYTISSKKKINLTLPTKY